MKTIVTLSGLMLSVLLNGCVSAEVTPVATSSIPAAALTNLDGSITISAPQRSGSAMSLASAGERLLAGATDGEPEFFIGGRVIDGGAVWRTTEPGISSNGWRSASLFAVATNHGVITRIRRTMVVVEPDLVAVLDDVACSERTSIERRFSFGSTLEHDAVRGEWAVQSDTAGVTAKFIGDSNARLSARATNGNGVLLRPAENATQVCFLAVFVIHPGKVKRSLAFKPLESESAIGVRVHRDGLPTLIAFRKEDDDAEANLAGLKFRSPMAVDIFRPKRK